MLGIRGALESALGHLTLSGACRPLDVAVAGPRGCNRHQTRFCRSVILDFHRAVGRLSCLTGSCGGGTVGPMIKTLLLALGVIASVSFAPATTTIPVAQLVVSPSSLNIGTPTGHCYRIPNHVVCTMYLRETTASNEPIVWQGVPDQGMGVTYSPSGSNTLNPGQTVKVVATITDGTCAKPLGTDSHFAAMLFVAYAPGVPQLGGAILYQCP
jgi:hypothetical protein